MAQIKYCKGFFHFIVLKVLNSMQLNVNKVTAIVSVPCSLAFEYSLSLCIYLKMGKLLCFYCSMF